MSSQQEYINRKFTWCKEDIKNSDLTAARNIKFCDYKKYPSISPRIILPPLNDILENKIKRENEQTTNEKMLNDLRAATIHIIPKRHLTIPHTMSTESIIVPPTPRNESVSLDDGYSPQSFDMMFNSPKNYQEDNVFDSDDIFGENLLTPIKPSAEDASKLYTDLAIGKIQKIVLNVINYLRIRKSKNIKAVQCCGAIIALCNKRDKTSISCLRLECIKLTKIKKHSKHSKSNLIHNPTLLDEDLIDDLILYVNTINAIQL